MSDPRELTGPEQRAILIMARWADEAGLRRCRWSLPNDASWPHPHLAGLPVRHDGLPNQYDLLARAPWRPERVVCSLHRSADGYEVTGVPGEEWLRREPGAPPASVGARPRLRLTAAAAGLLVPVGALGGFAVVMTGQQDQAPAPAAVAPTRIEPAPTPPLTANAQAWADAARVRLAAMSQHLETLTAAEAAWAALPPERRAGETPAEVRALQAALAELSQRRAALAAELGAFDGLREARTDLVATEERLAEVRSALALGDTAASTRLREQADRLARQSAEQRGRLASWQESLDEAIAAPLPAPVDAPSTAAAVIALAEQDPPPAIDREAPVVAAGREVEPDAAEVPDDDAGPDPDDDEPDRDGPDADRVEPDADRVELDVERHEWGGGSDNHSDHGVGVPDVVKDAAPVTDDLSRAVADPAEPAPSDDAPDAAAEPERGAAEPSEIDAAVDSHADEFAAAADRMEDMSLNDLLRQDGETDQELRERLMKAAQDYQRQAAPTEQR